MGISIGSGVSPSFCGTKPYDPTNEGDCVFWLEPDHGVIKDGLERVSSWGNHIPNGVAAVQAVNASKPIFVPNSRNGLPGISLIATPQFLTLGDLSALFPSAATLICAFEVNSNEWNLYKTRAGFADYWRFSGDAAGYFGPFRSSRVESYPAGMPNSGVHIVTVRSSAANYNVRVDGVNKGTKAAAYQGGVEHAIGYGGGYFAGVIYGMVAYSKALTDDGAVAAERYLSSKYAF